MSIIQRAARRASSAVLFAFCLVASSGPVQTAEVATPAAETSILGTWRAFAPAGAPRASGIMELRISAAEGGGLRVMALDQMRNPFGPMGTSLERDAEEYRASFDFFLPAAFGFTVGPVNLVAKLSPAGDRLEVVFADRTRRWPLAYKRADDPSFKKYDLPRMDAAGRSVTSYRYRAPTTREMATAEAASVGMPAEALERMVQDVLDRKQLYRDSLLVVKDGKLILEEYFYGFERDRLHTIMSITKATTGLVIGANVAEGKFDIERPIIEHFPDYPDSPWRQPDRKVTIEQLMRMANVLGWGEDTGFDTSGGYDYSKMGRQVPWVQGLFSNDLPGYLFAHTPLPDRPNSFFMYNTLSTQMTSLALARATRVKLRDEVAKRLLAPLGERDWHYFAYPGDEAETYEDSAPAAGSGLMLRPLALAKFGLMVSDCGRWDGRQLFPAEWIAKAAALRSIASDWSHSGYGHNWALDKIVSLPDGKKHWLVGHGGAGGQVVYIVPDYDLVFVTTAFDFEGESEHDEDDLLLNHLLPALAPPGTTFAPDHILPQDLHIAPLARCAGEANSDRGETSASRLRQGE